MNNIINDKYIAILLSTYNGEKYIEEQLNSLVAQTSSDFRVFIRDDGSKDNTLKICKKYEGQYGTKISILEDALGNIGVTKSFAKLMESVESELYMFCDQDDIWLPGKVDSAKRHYEEYLVNNNIEPVFFFTDLIPFKDDKRIVAESFLTSIGVNVRPNFENLIFSSPTWGCTCFFNNKMKELALPIPEYVRFHDYWMCILAYLRGRLIFVDEKEILYRLHTSNNSNAASTFDRLSFSSIKSRAKKFITGDEKGRDVLQRKLNQLVLALEKTSDRNNDYYKAMTGNVFLRIIYFLWTKSLAKRSIIFSPNLLMAVIKYKKKEGLE
jgi:rhamnosyltransferase